MLQSCCIRLHETVGVFTTLRTSFWTCMLQQAQMICLSSLKVQPPCFTHSFLPWWWLFFVFFCELYVNTTPFPRVSRCCRTSRTLVLVVSSPPATCSHFLTNANRSKKATNSSAEAHAQRWVYFRDAWYYQHVKLCILCLHLIIASCGEKIYIYIGMGVDYQPNEL